MHAALARLAPAQVTAPVGWDSDRGWILTRDGGQTLADRDGLAGPALADVLGNYAELQLATIDHRDTLVAAGLPDQPPDQAPQLLSTCLAEMASVSADDPRHLNHDEVEHLTTVGAEAVRNAASTLRQGIGSARLRPQRPVPRRNIFLPRESMLALAPGARSYRFFDFAESVWAHPFGSLAMLLSAAGASLRRRCWRRRSRSTSATRRSGRSSTAICSAGASSPTSTSCGPARGQRTADRAALPHRHLARRAPQQSRSAGSTRIDAPGVDLRRHPPAHPLAVPRRTFQLAYGRGRAGRSVPDGGTDQAGEGQRRLCGGQAITVVTGGASSTGTAAWSWRRWARHDSGRTAHGAAEGDQLEQLRRCRGPRGRGRRGRCRRGRASGAAAGRAGR